MKNEKITLDQVAEANDRSNKCQLTKLGFQGLLDRAQSANKLGELLRFMPAKAASVAVRDFYLSCFEFTFVPELYKDAVYSGIRTLISLGFDLVAVKEMVSWVKNSKFPEFKGVVRDSLSMVLPYKLEDWKIGMIPEVAPELLFTKMWSSGQIRSHTNFYANFLGPLRAGFCLYCPASMSVVRPRRMDFQLGLPAHIRDGYGTENNLRSDLASVAEIFLLNESYGELQEGRSLFNYHMQQVQGMSLCWIRAFGDGQYIMEFAETNVGFRVYFRDEWEEKYAKKAKRDSKNYDFAGDCMHCLPLIYLD